MKRTLLLLFLSFISLYVISQDLSIEETDEEWNEGSVTLSNGANLQGLLKYNDKTGILRFEGGNTSKTLTARNVKDYQYTDAKTNKNRLFFSIEYEDSKAGAIRPLFFELLREYTAFAVLSKTDPIDVDQSTTAMGTSPILMNSQIQISQSETLYFIKPGEAPIAVLKTTNKDISSSIGDGVLLSIPVKSKKTKSKIEDKGIIESFTEPYYNQLKDYARQQNLSFKKKDDLLTILDFYETLISE